MVGGGRDGGERQQSVDTADAVKEVAVAPAAEIVAATVAAVVPADPATTSTTTTTTTTTKCSTTVVTSSGVASSGSFLVTRPDSCTSEVSFLRLLIERRRWLRRMALEFAASATKCSYPTVFVISGGAAPAEVHKYFAQQEKNFLLFYGARELHQVMQSLYHRIVGQGVQLEHLLFEVEADMLQDLNPDRPFTRMEAARLACLLN